MTLKRVGFYGGTFDPIHFGHLSLAEQISEYHHLDEVWFCPAFVNPLRTGAPPVSSHHRKKMIELAIKLYPKFKVITTEIDKAGPSYTVDTLIKLKKEYPEIEFYLILGADAASSFEKWKNPSQILELAKPLIGARSGAKILSGPFADAFKLGLTPTKEVDVSSTEVRARLKSMQNLKGLVPDLVLDYIKENHLYECGESQ